uniref:Transmembrane protein n=1 Tax=Tricholoma bakamatsutake TaxID=51221 RepID=A0A6C0W3N5_9AGAR|nr:hypothetical protein [Tricholoma bakamatsutake]QIC20205.1 hypothetical protein [Tricholoma bakamatsutake]
MIKIYKRNMEIFLSVLKLPSVYKIKKIKYLLIFLLLIISSFILNNGIIYDIQYDLLRFLIFYLSIIFFLYLIFNLIIRIYNVFFRMFVYFRKQSNNINIDKNIIIGYYLYNIISLILTIILLYKLENSLINYDDTFLKYIYIYIFLCSIISSIIYIDYISEEIIVVKEVKIKKFSFFFLLFNIFLLSLTIIGVFKLSYFSFMVKNTIFSIKPFYFMGTDTNNNEVINIITEENKNEQEQSTPLNQRKVYVQSDDSVVHTNEQRQTLNNPSSSSSRIKSDEIIRGRTMERKPRPFGTTPSETSAEIRKEALFRKRRLILSEILDKKLREKGIIK